eukprot:TRINITY_DN273_c1_g1_i1.p1 TRINITY_DN273_c1_g1~~TRINITY_DN273_c1_g1_i1.p1  ORF type:complete len:609 (+),score=136.18 TRINITY_DN273_c1_g1_i1:185-2011(+)
MASNKSGTIVVDRLPQQCTTIHLFTAFRKYGPILRAWRTHGQQGLVTFSNMQDALTAVKNEHGRQVSNEPLQVTAAFYDITEPTKAGWWQCALCRWWTEAKNTSCAGFSCGLKKQEEGIAAIEEQLKEYASYDDVIPDNEPSMQQGQQGPQYYSYDQQQQQQPQQQPQYYEEAPMDYGTSKHPHPGGYSNGTYYPPQDYMPPPPPTAMHQQQQQQHHHRVNKYQPPLEHSPEVNVAPPPTQLNSHCVITCNVPTNITDKTLNKVFSKFAPSKKDLSGWVNVGAMNMPRALAEGQVLFDTADGAKAAVEGESSRAVDGEPIWCTYAEEVFIISVVAAERDQWNSIMSVESDPNQSRVLAELSPVFESYGKRNSYKLHENVLFIEYYSLTSALDAISNEDGMQRAGFTLQVALAPCGTRWPCSNCLKINSAADTHCEVCNGQRTPIHARSLKDAIIKAITENQGYGDSYRGYCCNPSYDGVGNSPTEDPQLANGNGVDKNYPPPHDVPPTGRMPEEMNGGMNGNMNNNMNMTGPMNPPMPIPQWKSHSGSKGSNGANSHWRGGSGRGGPNNYPQGSYRNSYGNGGQYRHNGAPPRGMAVPNGRYRPEERK